MNFPRSIYTAPGSFTNKPQTPPVHGPRSSPLHQHSDIQYINASYAFTAPAPNPQASLYRTDSVTLYHEDPSSLPSAPGAHTAIIEPREAPQDPADAAQPVWTTPEIQRPSTPQDTHHKRALDEVDGAEESPTSVTKRTRLQSSRKHYLDHLSFTSLGAPAQEPPSPLFFSHSPHLRPSFPARFTSSEAAAKMLSKAKTEESHVKTVTLARGIVSTPAPGYPHRALSDRSSVARSASPDPSNRADPSQGMLASFGIVELLDQDERPTLIVDLADSANYGPGALKPIYVNPSLRSYNGLIELATGILDDDSTDDAVRDFIHFKSWLLSAAVNGESLNVCLPAFRFAGISWSCSTLRKRLRIASGTPSSDAPPPGVKLPKPTPHANGAPLLSPQLPDRPPLSTGVRSAENRSDRMDYFGDATVPLEGRRASNDIVQTAESPLSRSQTDATDPSLQGLPSDGRYSDMSAPLQADQPSFDWTRLPVSDSMPKHIQFARSVDWASTSLGPVETWNADLRQMCNLIMASPHPAAMYWGEDLIAIYNEAYILLAGQKHPVLMGQSYRDAWVEIWDEVKDVFASAKQTGEATMKDDDCLFIQRNGFLEEAYFSWSIIPMVGSDGSVVGLYNPAFEKTRRKIAERRMLTLREIGERTATARDVRGFWENVLAALELNEYDTPLVLLYSVNDDSESDSASIQSSSTQVPLQCYLEGSLGIPEGHVAAPATIDFRSGTEGFGPVFREVIKTARPVLLEVGSKDLPESLLQGLDNRGFGDPCRAVVVCPVHPTTGESILGFLVLGVNPRRPYDEDYSLFVQLLSRQLATSLASVVLFEEEIRRGQRAAKLAALDRIELSEKLAVQTRQAIESETKFTRMAEFAPVGMLIANSEGAITFRNDAWYDIAKLDRSQTGMAGVDEWMDAIKEEDKHLALDMWKDLTVHKKTCTGMFRFKTPWIDSDGSVGDRWVLFSAYPERDETGNLKSVFGCFTDISKQKWAEDFQKRKMEEAVELKRQQENFIDMTSHEMRNPLSAILQCADEVLSTMNRIRDSAQARSQDFRKTLEDALTNTLEAAQTIALCAQHQKRIVDDILTLSKLDSKLLLVTPVDAQPLTVVQRALKMHEGELQSNDIQLQFVVEGSYKELAIDWVRFDPSRVLQVLINLTTNAIKFTTTESKRTITVMIGASAQRPSSGSGRLVEYFPTRYQSRHSNANEADWGDGEEVFIHFAVQDTGRGLTNQERKMLFLRFSQASPRTHVQYGGSGLGLFISRELTELQGGEIGVASEAGKGSTFAFYVKARRSTGPVGDDARLAHALDLGAGSLSRTVSIDQSYQQYRESIAAKTKHILVVEDNLVNQRVLTKQLKNLGCHVYVANHGGEALDRLRASIYWHTKPQGRTQPTHLSVVLMDQEMPVMDGLTCTKKIREMEKEGLFRTHVPIIAVTANARTEQIQTALDAGMDDVVSKPFRIPDLIPKIEELMERYPEPALLT